MNISLSKTKLIKNSDELVYNHSCLISGDILDNSYIEQNRVIRLRCGHSFRYDFFIKSVYEMNKKIEGFYKCPYCMNNIDKIPCILSKKMLSKTIYNMRYNKDYKIKNFLPV